MHIEIKFELITLSYGLYDFSKIILSFPWNSLKNNIVY